MGLDSVEAPAKPWPDQAPVVALSTTPSLDALVPAQIEAVGDLKVMLKSLTALTSGGAAWGEKTAATFRQDVVDALDTPSRRSFTHAPWRSLAQSCRGKPSPLRRWRKPPAGRAEMAVLWPARSFSTSNGLGSHGIRRAGCARRCLAILTVPSSPLPEMAVSSWRLPRSRRPCVRNFL